MLNNLLLITGAGASHDVIDLARMLVSESLRPPLTKNLFYPPLYNEKEIASKGEESGYILECLESHPLAAQVGYEFYNRFGKNGKEANLEEYLSELKNNKKYIIKTQFWAIPLYLYDLFYKISNDYLPSSKGLPSNYKSLIDRISESSYTQIIWLNLNYDLLADYTIKISTNHELKSFDDYMKIETQDGLKIKYTKPHGSVDWFKRLDDPTIEWIDIKSGNLPTDFENRLSKEIYTFNSLPKVRTEDIPGGFRVLTFPEGWYPAVTAPIGEYDYVYQKHIEAILPELKFTTSVLCIGFSALDIDILNLIRDNIKQIDNLKIVNGSIGSAKEAYEHIEQHCSNLNVVEETALFDGGFTKFIQDGIDEWLNL